MLLDRFAQLLVEHLSRLALEQRAQAPRARHDEERLDPDKYEFLRADETLVGEMLTWEHSKRNSSSVMLLTGSRIRLLSSIIRCWLSQASPCV